MRTNRIGILGRVIAAGLAGWVAIGPVVAEAAIDDALSGFFATFGGYVGNTPPGAYESQTRGYLTGGTYNVRMPMQTTQLAFLTPPTFNMGCNGFDATFGGLSYVSLDRFIQLLQQLGTGAVMGFAFQLAMEYLSPTIGSVLSKIEAASRFVNTLGNVQPCQAGMAAGRALADVMAGKTPDLSMFENRWRTIQGAAMDLWEQSHTTGSKTPSDTASALAGDQNWDIRGNLVWDVLHYRLGNWPADDARQVTSLVGTVIVDDTGHATEYPPTLDVRDLLDAQSQDVPVYQCQDSACLNMTVGMEPMTGLYPRVAGVLFNLTDELYQRSPLQAQVVTWINYSQVPIYRIFSAYQGDYTMLVQLTRDFSRLIAAEMLHQYVSGLLYTLEEGALRYKQQRPTWNGDIRSVRERLVAVRAQAREISSKEAQALDAKWSLVAATQKYSNTGMRTR